jgi:transposase
MGFLLQPIYDRMIEELRKNPHWHADETRWKVFELLEGKKSFLWWLWVFSSKNIVVYVIDPTRAASVIEKIHDQGKRTISADRYSSYESMKKHGVNIAYCWVHLRRDFIQLQKNKSLVSQPKIGKWIEDWLDDIKQLYYLNKLRLNSDSEQEYSALTKRMHDITESLRLQEEDRLVLECQKKILRSFKKRFAGYTLFLDHPQIPMDNNRAERLIKAAISGRNNYLGNVSQKSVIHTQIFLSIMSTAKINKVDPQQWLTEYLEACAKNDSDPLEGELLEHHLNRLLGTPS